MKFSVIIPLYNKSNTIRRAIYSAIDQSNIDLNDIEVIVVDDGSTDDSIDQVKLIQEENCELNIRLHQQPNAGVSAARNQGVALSRHEFVAFLDADDSYKPNYLHTISSLIETFPQCGGFATAYSWVWSNSGVVRSNKLSAIKHGEASQILENFFLSCATGDLPFNTSSLCVRKQVFNELGGFPEGENMGEDQSLFSNLALQHKIAFHTQPCTNYYQDVAGSLMQTEEVINEMPYSKRLQYKLDSNKIPANLEHSVRLYIAGHLLDLVRRNLRNGKKAAALNLLRDNRSSIRPVKWLYWNVRARVLG